VEVPLLFSPSNPEGVCSKIMGLIYIYVVATSTGDLCRYRNSPIMHCAIFHVGGFLRIRCYHREMVASGAYTKSQNHMNQRPIPKRPRSFQCCGLDLCYERGGGALCSNGDPLLSAGSALVQMGNVKRGGNWHPLYLWEVVGWSASSLEASTQPCHRSVHTLASREV